MPRAPYTPLIPVAPTPPDIHHCDHFYGTNLDHVQCSLAGSRLPVGTNPVVYESRGSTIPYVLPWVVRQGSCVITIELAGPARTRTIAIRPDFIRGMAGWVIEQCATRSGLGGFATGQIGNLLNEFSRPRFGVDEDWRTSTSYITVTVSGPMAEPAPGDDDPVTVGLIREAVRDALSVRPQLPRLQGFMIYLSLQRLFMRRGDSMPWWALSVLSGDTMSYECDAKLGSPHAIDCSNLEQSQLGYPSDALLLEPNAAKTLTSNSCKLTISTSTLITVTWEQIKAALNTLLYLCVGNSANPSTGGIAHYGLQSATSIGKLTGKAKRRANQVNGLNALPKHVSITVSHT